MRVPLVTRCVQAAADSGSFHFVIIDESFLYP
jgi:hypothetical protein